MKNEILNYLSQDNPWKDRISYYESITSTNDVLKLLAQQGAPHGTVLIANQQTGGRGRMGRSFLSPSGVGIYMSVLLRLDCTPAELMHLTCAAALAACEAIDKAVGIEAGIKWTNDIVYRKRKLAGILTELGFQNPQKVDYAIIGIGINCCQSENDFPKEIRGFAGSLAMVSGHTVSRAKVAACLVDAFAEMNTSLLDHHAEILEKYRKRCITIGQDVSVVRGDTVRYGKAIDVDDEGALVVAFTNGKIEAVNSGEVSVRGLYNYVS